MIDPKNLLSWVETSDGKQVNLKLDLLSPLYKRVATVSTNYKEVSASNISQA
jgi:hypothetical protein